MRKYSNILWRGAEFQPDYTFHNHVCGTCADNVHAQHFLCVFVDQNFVKLAAQLFRIPKKIPAHSKNLTLGR